MCIRDRSQITLKNPVPVGATVYASYYYNSLTDAEFTLTCDTSGPSGIGTYMVGDGSGNSIFGATFDVTSKGAGLDGITVQFPSGSEYRTDLRFEAADEDGFTGPMEEIVTVTFANTEATPAVFTVPAAGPYNFAEDASDKLRLELDSNASTTDLQNPTAAQLGANAVLLGRVVSYDASTDSASWTL